VARRRIQSRNAISPWPFIGMVAMAATLFLYGVSGLVAPWWGVVGLLVFWLVLFVIACRWWTPHPKRMLILPVIAVVVWFGTLTAGGAWLDWTA
jgi:prepilin signal peptidase PulO-like enzyme (type II secretory pathway)